MSDFSLLGGGGRIVKLGSNLYGDVTTSSAAANSKGSWVQMTASTPFDGGGLLIGTRFGDQDRHMVDVGIGAASSEQVIISNLFLFGSGGAGGETELCLFPISIPVGTRIAVRSTSHLAGGRVCYTRMWLIPSTLSLGMPSANRVSTLGANTGSTIGTTVTPGISGAEGSWVQMSSSTPHDIKMIYIMGGNNHLTSENSGYTFDIAVGAAASEQIIIPDITYSSQNISDDHMPHYWGPFLVDIPEGSRVAIRSSGESGTARDIYFVIYGIG